ERAAEADQARGSVAVETAQFVRQSEQAPAVDDLADKTKAELLDLAASLDVDGRSAMTKDELLKAIRRASAPRRAASSRAGG
ncbi:MAG: Rho termination factor N-terminal domain-containing protein, partial [Thermoleophilia bacterium]